MSTAVLTISYQLSAPTFPAGTVVDHLVVSITGVTNPTVAQKVAAAAPSVTFDNVQPDNYTYSVQAVDATGASLGTAVTGSFNVAAPATISLSLPSAVAVTVA